MTVASLVPTAWAISRADMAPAGGPVASRNSTTDRSIGLLRSADLAAKVEDVVFSSAAEAMCSKCYMLRRGWNLKNEALLLLAVVLATAVEMVEALTIVLAVGVTRGWRATLAGVGAALAVLGVVVAALGPAISHLSLTPLRLIVGGLLLMFGMQWIRKAILRASGYKAIHDEDVIYGSTQASASEAPRRTSFDGYSFTVAFKGVFLEGLEVVFIVLTFGATQHRLALSALVASVTVLAVAAVGVVVHRPLSRVPENTLKFIVGILLTSFGMFWSAEGAGVAWPGGESAVPALIALVAGTSVFLARALRRQHRRILAHQLPS
jgi:uncharacterized membrane protein